MLVLGSGFFRRRTGVFRVKVDYVGKSIIFHDNHDSSTSFSSVEKIFSQTNPMKAKIQIQPAHCKQKQLKIDYLPSKQSMGRNLDNMLQLGAQSKLDQRS